MAAVLTSEVEEDIHFVVPAAAPAQHESSRHRRAPVSRPRWHQRANRRTRHLPRQRVSLWTLFLRRPPSSAQVEPPKGNPFGREDADGGNDGDPRTPGHAGNMAGRRQGPFASGQSGAGAPRTPDSCPAPRPGSTTRPRCAHVAALLPLGA
jgi:hypothetical protein